MEQEILVNVLRRSGTATTNCCVCPNRLEVWLSAKPADCPDV